MSGNAVRIRCFAACFVDAGSWKILSPLAPRISGMRTVPPEKLHVTLRFFGALESAEVSRALDLVHQLPAGEPRAVGIAGMTGFPTLRRATTLVVTLQSDSILLLWHSWLSAGLGGSSEPFAPHVTVARSRRPVEVSSVATLPPALDGQQILLRPPGLYASETGPEGAWYRRIE